MYDTDISTLQTLKTRKFLPIGKNFQAFSVCIVTSNSLCWII